MSVSMEECSRDICLNTSHSRLWTLNIMCHTHAHITISGYPLCDKHQTFATILQRKVLCWYTFTLQAANVFIIFETICMVPLHCRILFQNVGEQWRVDMEKWKRKCFSIAVFTTYLEYCIHCITAKLESCLRC